MSQLLACPFCRELFDRAETEQCPDCELRLEPLHQLPPSREALEQDALRWERTDPIDRDLPWRDLGRGRGVLLVLASLSLVVFCAAPWLELSAPHLERRSGLSLARGPLGFLWGGAAAWLANIALVATRRSIRQMRAARPLVMTLAALTGSEVALLLVMSPARSPHVPVSYAWGWGLYAALAASGLGVLAAARFGGSPPPVPEGSRAGTHAGGD